MDDAELFADIPDEVPEPPLDTLVDSDFEDDPLLTGTEIPEDWDEDDEDEV